MPTEETTARISKFAPNMLEAARNDVKRLDASGQLCADTEDTCNPGVRKQFLAADEYQMRRCHATTPGLAMCISSLQNLPARLSAELRSRDVVRLLDARMEERRRAQALGGL